MANAFSKEERVAFEKILQGFEDALVMSKLVDTYNPESQMMERTGDVVWRPQPYIATSYDGTDQTNNFKDYKQLSVPAVLGFNKSVPWILSATELRDLIQSGRLGQAAKQKLASDINVAVSNCAALQGTIVVTKATAASGYIDVANIDAAMNRVGVQGFDRYAAYATSVYNLMAADLANRGTLTGKALTAYERSRVGNVAGIETFKLDYARRLTAAAGGAGLTMDTRTTATSNHHIPKATTVGDGGQRSNYDNRTQRITISSTTSVAAGDCFTIAGVYEVHHITKDDTGSLKTFRVMSVDSATTMTISPPIISAGAAVVTPAEVQYQNCTVTGSATAALVFLNTVTAPVNPFWQQGAIELMPGNYMPPTDAGAQVMKSTTENGIPLLWTKQYDINTMKTKYRLDTFFGVNMLQPEMAGIELFGQT